MAVRIDRCRAVIRSASATHTTSVYILFHPSTPQPDATRSFLPSLKAPDAGDNNLNNTQTIDSEQDTDH
jgi:hypothetical protein